MKKRINHSEIRLFLRASEKRTTKNTIKRIHFLLLLLKEINYNPAEKTQDFGLNLGGKIRYEFISWNKREPVNKPFSINVFENYPHLL